MYLIVIPLFGLLVGFLGGAFHKQMQFCKLAQKGYKFGWIPIIGMRNKIIQKPINMV